MGRRRNQVTPAAADPAADHTRRPPCPGRQFCLGQPSPLPRSATRPEASTSAFRSCRAASQAGKSVEESVDDVCIYTAHLWAAWG